MATITTGTHPKLLWPGMHKLFGLTYGDIPMKWSDVFTSETSDKAYEEEQELTGFGLAPVKSEGGSISFDTTSQGYTKRYTNVTYGLGFIETRESVEDNQYKGRATSKTRALARSMAQTKETVCANILNRAFNASYVGGDGKELIATDHPTMNGTQSNELAVAADLSEASLEDLITLTMNATDSRGLRINLMPRSLIVASDNWANAQRIVDSDLQNDTDKNAINVMRGVFPEGVCVWQYLTDPDAFFIKTDITDGLKHFTRRAVDFAKDGDFDTDNFKHKATERYAVGWTDWRGLYGTPGAA